MPTKARMRQRSTAQVRDDSMMTVVGLRDLHARIERQLVDVRGKVALMEEGPERLELSLMLLALVNKQAEIANQIDVRLARKN
jgi:hypothetical protein